MANIAKSHPLDIVAPQHLSDWLAKHDHLDAVFHMGAISSTTEKDADLVFDVNVRFSSQIWEWCSVHRTRLIYASSAATYGDGRAGFDDDDDGSSLGRLRPLNAYGWSKHFFDRRVSRWVAAGEKTPPQWVGLKFFNVFGPNEYHKGPMQSVVVAEVPARHFRPAGNVVQVISSGLRRRRTDAGFIYVDDCVKVIMWLLDNPEANGLFNLGTGKARSFADLARALAEAAENNRASNSSRCRCIRTNYQYFTEARMDRLRLAGYGEPFTRLEEGIRRYVERCTSQAGPLSLS